MSPPPHGEGDREAVEGVRRRALLAGLSALPLAPALAAPARAEAPTRGRLVEHPAMFLFPPA